MIGKMREYVTIYEATRVDDGQGGATTTWAKVADEWSRVESLSTSRTLDGSGIKYTSAVRMTARKRADTPSNLYALDGSFKVQWNSVDYTIHSVTPDEKGNYIVILAYK